MLNKRKKGEKTQGKGVLMTDAIEEKIEKNENPASETKEELVAETVEPVQVISPTPPHEEESIVDDEAFIPKSIPGVLTDSREREAAEREFDERPEPERRLANQASIRSNPYDDESGETLASMVKEPQKSDMAQLYEMLMPNPKRTAEEEARLKRQKEATSLILGIADAINGLSNLGATIGGAPSRQVVPMSGKYQDAVQAAEEKYRAKVDDYNRGRYGAFLQDYQANKRAKDAVENQKAQLRINNYLNGLKWGEVQRDAADAARRDAALAAQKAYLQDDINRKKHQYEMDEIEARNAGARGVAEIRGKASTETARIRAAGAGTSKYSDLTFSVPNATGGNRTTYTWRIPDNSTTQLSIMNNFKNIIEDVKSEIEQQPGTDKKKNKEQIVLDEVIREMNENNQINLPYLVSFITQKAPSVWTEIAPKINRFMQDNGYEMVAGKDEDASNLDNSVEIYDKLFD